MVRGAGGARDRAAGERVTVDDAKLIRFAEAIRRGFLEMLDCTSESMCLVLSVPLVELLDMVGLSVEVRMSFVDVGGGARWNHFWIRLPDGWARTTAEMVIDRLARAKPCS